MIEYQIDNIQLLFLHWHKRYTCTTYRELGQLEGKSLIQSHAVLEFSTFVPRGYCLARDSPDVFLSVEAHSVCDTNKSFEEPLRMSVE